MQGSGLGARTALVNVIIVSDKRRDYMYVIGIW